MTNATYQAITRGIRVSVTPQFLDDESDAEEGRFVWAYTIEIANQGKETVQLDSRAWIITDERGQVENVRGPGVVGETPILEPGQGFRYTSGCHLTTPSGIMAGTYQMSTNDGVTFDVEIPAFSLDSAVTIRSLN